MEKKIKIAVFIRGFHNGGIEKVFELYYSHMDLSPYEIHMITHMKNSPDRKKIFTDMGCIVHELSPIRGHKINETNRKEYKGLFSNNDFDIVHNNMPEIGLPLKYAKKYKVKTRIMHAHSEYIKALNSNIKKQIYKWGFIYNAKKANVLIAISKSSAKSTYFNRYKEAVILTNAIEVEKFAFDKQTRLHMRDKLGYGSEFVIGHVGRFESDVKNQALIIEVFKKLIKQNPDVRLLLIGDGKKKTIFENDIMQNGLKDKVIFTGNVSNVQDYLMAMDMFLFPSKQEGLGIAAIEAQASGLHCIVSKEVPSEVKLTNKVSFLPIYGENVLSLWENAIIELIKKNDSEAAKREDDYKYVREAGYDIEKKAINLANIYGTCE